MTNITLILNSAVMWDENILLESKVQRSSKKIQSFVSDWKKKQLVSSFVRQKSTSNAYCQTAPVKQSVTPELSPTAVMYSPLNFISIQHFQDFSYVTWAHPDISSAITQYLNLGGILRRSPLDPDGDFCLFLGAKQSV